MPCMAWQAGEAAILGASEGVRVLLYESRWPKPGDGQQGVQLFGVERDVVAVEVVQLLLHVVAAAAKTIATQTGTSLYVLSMGSVRHVCQRSGHNR